MRDLVCSSHTISGVMPGEAMPARHGLGERLAACAAAGYSGLWLHLRDYLAHRSAGWSDEQLRAMFDANDMRYRGIEFLTDWFLDTPEAVAHRQAAFAAAQAIGATIISVGGDFAGRQLPRRRMKDRFADLCREAAGHGVTVALEFVPWSDVPDIGTALDFLEPANAGIVIDCWHLFRGGMTPADMAQVPADRIACIQLSDATATPSCLPLAEDTRNRLPCGEGAFDLAAFLGMLDTIAPAVPASVEIIAPRFAAMSAEEAAFESIRGAADLVRARMRS